MTDRIHVWHYVLNEEGQPIADAEIRFYLNDDQTTEANIYVTETSVSYTTCSVANIKTDGNGFFEFWINDNQAAGGYDLTQLFKLEWFKPGIKTGSINDYNPWPNITTLIETSAGGDVDYKNKFVSNYFINRCLSHVILSIIPSAASYTSGVHGIYPVDYESGCDNDDYNKVVSNKFLNDIVNNCDVTNIHPISASEVAESYSVVESVDWTPSASPSGYCYHDFTHPSISGAYVVLIDDDTLEEIIPSKIIFMTHHTTKIVIKGQITTRVSINGLF